MDRHLYFNEKGDRVRHYAIQLVPRDRTNLLQIYTVIVALDGTRGETRADLENSIFRYLGFQLYKCQYWEYETPTKEIKALARFVPMKMEKMANSLGSVFAGNRQWHNLAFPTLLAATSEALPDFLTTLNDKDKEKERYAKKYLNKLRDGYLQVFQEGSSLKNAFVMQGDAYEKVFAW